MNVEAQGNDHVKTSLDGDTATSKGSSQWDDMTPEQKETVMTAFNGVAVDKVLKGVERGKGRNGFVDIAVRKDQEKEDSVSHAEVVWNMMNKLQNKRMIEKEVILL